MEEILLDIARIRKESKKIPTSNKNFTSFWEWYFEIRGNGFSDDGIELLAVFSWPILSVIFISPLYIMGALEILDNYLKNDFFIFFLGIIVMYLLFIFPFQLPGMLKRRRDKIEAEIGTKIQELRTLPEIISKYNESVQNFLMQNDFKNISEISERVLQIIEDITQKRKRIQKYFRDEYILQIDTLIFKEIQLLQKILKYSFKNQITHHEKIIADISHLQNISEKNYKDILELQKTRLEKQKEIFEKFLQK